MERIHRWIAIALQNANAFGFAAAIALVLSIAPGIAAAQTDVVRGRIIGPDSAPVARATITVTSLTGNVSRTARTDADGKYTIAFPGSDGDYFVNVAALGFAAKRFQIKRNGDQDILIANAKLSAVVQQLDAVKVDATRQRPTRGDLPPDISGSERPVNASTVSADQLGDLASLAASLPGVQLIPSSDGTPNGFSVLGLTADQNATTLNGMPFGGASLPRDASVSTSLVTTPYDVSRGNFSGGLMSVRTQPGSNYVVRVSSTNADAPSMQWTNPAAPSLGQRFGGLSTGGRASGPIQFNRSFYSIAYQAGRRAGDLQSLLNADRPTLVADGLAPDSVSRLISALGRSRIPTTVSGLPGSRLNDNAMLFGTIDVAPPTSTSGQSYNLTFNGTWNRQDPASMSPAELETHSGERSNWYGGVQARASGYYGIGILSETSIGLNRLAFGGNPFLDLPSATVRVNSILPDGTSGVQSVAVGGNAVFGTSQTATTAQIQNQLSWFTEDNTHRIKLTTELRRDQYSQNVAVNPLGAFTFESIGDLEAGRASSFVRSLSSQRRSESDYAGGISVGDSYSPTANLQVQYGVRMDGNRFNTAPVYNADVERVFGVRNDRAPNLFAASPRVGFSWMYGKADQASAFEGAAMAPRAVIRGGAGVFQSTPNAALVGNAMDNTGLAGGARQIMCVGSAVPIPNWAAYGTDASTIPSACADGSAGSVLANAAPNVTLFDRQYSAPRSVRSNLGWNGPVFDKRVALFADITYSLNLGAASLIDLNFDRTPRFSLSDDGRPVFARTTGIVANSGAISSAEGRVSPAFARVVELRSDMRSETRQLTLQVRPGMLDTRFTWGLSYVYSQARERTRGFNSTAADPLDVSWSRSGLDSRHQFVYALTYNAFDAVRVSWYGTARSGNPYTPVVAQDINGDGFVNDRAYVADPAVARDAAVANGMRTLLSSASGPVRNCLTSQLGKIASRNSCQGPWASTGSLSFTLDPRLLRMPQRADVSFQLSNPFAAADMMLHGSDRLRGWGQQSLPVNDLLIVRGFDPVAKRYLYDVNQRFGTNSLSDNSRAPISVTLMVRFDVGPTRERQALTQMLDRGRSQPGQRISEPVIKALYGVATVVNPMAQILRQADSLALNGDQADSIAVLNRAYTLTLDSIWTPVSKRLALLPDAYKQGEAYREYQRAREATVDALMRVAPLVRSLLSASQLRRVPSSVTAYLDTRYLASVRSGTAGTGLGAVMMDGLALPPGVGNASQAAIMMMHGGITP